MPNPDFIKYWVGGTSSDSSYGLTKEEVEAEEGEFPISRAQPNLTVFKTYTTLIWANVFFKDYAFQTVWNDASDEKRQSALNAATDFIDTYCQFFNDEGEQVYYQHAGFDDDFDNIVNPYILKEACALEASYLLSLDDNPAEPLPITILGLLKGDFGQVDKEYTPPIFTKQVIKLLTMLGGVIDMTAQADLVMAVYEKSSTN